VTDRRAAADVAIFGGLLLLTRLQLGAGALLVALVVVCYMDDERPGRGNHEWDMGYLRVVRTHQEAAAFLEREFPGRSVRARFPHWAILSRPRLGYVRQARPVVAEMREPGADQSDAATRSDLVVTGLPGSDDWLERDAARRGLRRLRQFGEGDMTVTVYAGPGGGAP
jgi:hypothetical protein